MINTNPSFWKKVQLGEIIQPRSERANPKDYPTLPYVGLENVEPQTMRLVGYQHGRDVRSTSGRFAKGDVLYGRLRPYLNKVWVAEFEGLCSGEFIVFPAVEGLNSRFLAARLSCDDFVEFADSQTSGERPRVHFPKLARFELSVPSTEEQGRIIDKLFRAIDAQASGENASRRALEKIQRYRLAIFDAALTGELTIGSRAKIDPSRSASDRSRSFDRRLQSDRSSPFDLDSTKPDLTSPNVRDLPTIPAGWNWVTAEMLSDPARPITYGVIKLGPDVPEGIPILRSSDVRRLEIELGSVKRISPTIADRYSRTYLQGKEVLVTVRGTLGGVASVPPACVGFNVSREVAVFALADPSLSQLVAYFIASPVLQNWMANRTRGIAYTGLNIATLRTLPIPLPPPAEAIAIVSEIKRRLAAADKLTTDVLAQLERSNLAKKQLLADAFSGKLVPQDQTPSAAEQLISRLRNQRPSPLSTPARTSRRRRGEDLSMAISSEPILTSPVLREAWGEIEKKPDALELFRMTGLTRQQIPLFYEVLRSTPEVLKAFQQARPRQKAPRPLAPVREPKREGTEQFRLVHLWLGGFKNLQDYSISFDPSQGLDVVLGWNGTGKSNLFEALVIIFRDLHAWWERNRWPSPSVGAFSLKYQIDGQMVRIDWQPQSARRPELHVAPLAKGRNEDWTPLKREDLPLPRFIFGYYSGPTNRLADHFLPMKQGHYDRLRTAKADDAQTLARLLEQRRFFCAETHHAKYVLLGFSYKEDPKINSFLENKLRIVGFESALFVIRKPAWAKPNSKAEDFWGATGIMRRVMERLRKYAIAPMVVEQRVNYGYRSATEDHYYFFLPDLESLHAFAAEYPDARTFFLALESTDFSELIHDVLIQVRVKSTNSTQVAITFHQMSEGEQQLLMVLGLMRFTKSHQSLVLLDEPDTHLNPHWSVDYLKDLARVMSDGPDGSKEQQTSQILLATHDPLVIASLVRQQIHLLRRDSESQACRAETPDVDPKGLGFTGILTSEIFGFRSDLDPETLADLDARVRLIAKEDELTESDKTALEGIEKRLAGAGFTKAFSDPYYAAFVRAWSRRFSEAMAGAQTLTDEKRKEIDGIAAQVLEEAIAEVDKEAND